jgi:hypothetical protein
VFVLLVGRRSDMKIAIDFYKVTGKWYESCEIDIPEFENVMYKLSHAETLNLLYTKQICVTTPRNFHMVARNVDENGVFFHRLFLIGQR